VLWRGWRSIGANCGGCESCFTGETAGIAEEDIFLCVLYVLCGFFFVVEANLAGSRTNNAGSDLLSQTQPPSVRGGPGREPMRMGNCGHRARCCRT